MTASLHTGTDRWGMGVDIHWLDVADVVWVKKGSQGLGRLIENSHQLPSTVTLG
jgi:hypothetical protein